MANTSSRLALNHLGKLGRFTRIESRATTTTTAISSTSTNSIFAARSFATMQQQQQQQSSPSALRNTTELRLGQVGQHLHGRTMATSASGQGASAAGAAAPGSGTKKRTGGGDGGDEPKVLVRQEGTTSTIILNRPKALNALDTEMIEMLIEAIDTTPQNTHIVLRGVGRALCSGGDVLAVVNNAASEDPKVRQQALDFFQLEFGLNYKIATLHQGKQPRAYVSVMDGITMGGGVGLSLHAPIRIATEKTLFAMPETGIGYFPDVGVTRCLSRLDGKVGQYLGMTGARISGEEAYLAGIATHFIPSSNIDAALHRLISLPPNAPASQLATLLDEYTVDPFNGETNAKGPEVLAKTALLGDRRIVLDYAFGQPSAEAVVSALGELASGSQDTQAAEELKAMLGIPQVDQSISKFASQTLETLNLKAPRSLKVALMAITEARRLDLDEQFRFDMRLATVFCDLSVGRDFHTGVLHTLTKDPKTGKRREGVAPWNPPSLDQVNDEKIRTLFFGPVEKAKEAGLQMVVPKIEGLSSPYSSSSSSNSARDQDKRRQDELRGLGPLNWERSFNPFALPSEAECAALVQGSHPASGSTALEADEVVGTLVNVKGGHRPALALKVRDWLERAQKKAGKKW